jgi:hypothetical protein
MNRRATTFGSTVLLLMAGGTAQLAAQQRVFEIRPAGRVMYVSLDTVDTPAGYQAGPLTVYRALREVYRLIDIPVTFQDSVTGRLGNLGTPMRRIAGKRMSTWVRCGEGLTGSYADIHRVTISVISWVQAVTLDSAVVRTGVFGGAVDVAEGSGQMPRQCATTGLLEDLLRTRLQQLLAAAEKTGSR